MRFGSLLKQKFQTFGRQLGNGAKSFGRQVTNFAHKASQGIGKAQNFISRIERPLAHVPILGTGLQTIGSVLGGARNVADMTASGGQALTNVAGGDFTGAAQNLNSARGSFNALGQNVTGAATSGALTAAGAAAFL
jgi:hypothetical protein